MERRILCGVSIEWVEPIAFEVNSVDQRHASICIEHAFRDEVFDLAIRLIAYPVIDLLTDGFVLVDEICQSNPRSIVQRDRIEKTLEEGIGLFSPDGIGNIELERRLVFGLGLAVFGKLKVEGIESGMKLILR